MRRFLYALAMLLLTVWSRTWKKIFRSKRTFFTTATVAGLVLVLWIGFRLGGGTDTEPATATPTAEASDTVPYRTTTAEPLSAGTPSDAPSAGGSLEGVSATEEGPSAGDGPQAAESGEVLEVAPREVAAPTQPSANPDKAAEVAEAWTTAYLSRDAGNSEQWQEWMRPYAVPELADYLTEADTEQDNPIAARAPSEVTDVKIGDKAPEGAPADTPVRWTRSVDAAVATGDGRTTTITYELTLNRTDDGWKVRNAVENGWTTKATP